jgi:quercetin 2,3-dioxygenase
MTERRGVLRLLVSQDGREGSLRLRQDAGVYSSILDPGHHLIHEMASGRGAWLHVIGGRIHLAGRVMDPGDGASLQDEAAVSLTAQVASKILLFDLR